MLPTLASFLRCSADSRRSGCADWARRRGLDVSALTPKRSSTENRLKSFKYLDLNLFTETSRLQSNKHVWSRWHFLWWKLWHGEVHHAVWDSAKSYRTITHPTSHIEIALLAFQMCSIFCKLGAPQPYLTQVFEALLRQSIAHHLDMIIARCTSRRHVKIVTIIGLSK